MINKKSKTAFQIILGGIMLVSVATIGCNDTSTKTEPKTDTAAMPAAPAAPAVVDTPKMKMDTTANQKPIVPGNKPADKPSN